MDRGSQFLQRGLIDKGADALIRAHDPVRFRPLEPMREIGRIATGAVDEQWVELTGANAQGLRLRHIRLRLDKTTRDGDQTLYLLSSAAPALFALACAVVAYNVLAVAKAACWHAIHGSEAADALSGYHMAIELSNVAGSLDTVLAPKDWAVFHAVPLAVFAAWLQEAGAANESAALPKERARPEKACTQAPQ